MTEGIRIGVCGVMAIMSLLGSFGVEGLLHQFTQDNGRIDLANGINGARKLLLLNAAGFVIAAFL